MPKKSHIYFDNTIHAIHFNRDQQCESALPRAIKPGSHIFKFEYRIQTLYIRNVNKLRQQDEPQ